MVMIMTVREKKDVDEHHHHHYDFTIQNSLLFKSNHSDDNGWYEVRHNYTRAYIQDDCYRRINMIAAA